MPGAIRAVLGVLAVVAAIIAPVGGAAETRWEAPEAVVPGDVLRVVADSDGDELAAAELTLVGSDGEAHVERVHFFRTTPTEWVALAGVPSTLLPGDYAIIARVGPDADPVRLPLRVAERAFAELDIPLDASLTDLRRLPDPRKEQQALALLALLRRFDRGAVFHHGRLRLPLAELRSTSDYGDRRRYLYADGSTALSIHHGIDLAAVQGGSVRAAGAGRVVMAEYRIVTGNTVVLEHLPGVFSLYYHLHTMRVAVGDRVAAAAEIGTVGRTGLATGSHLHWEVRVAAVPVDPMRLVAVPLLAGSE